jgi:hypothetical protein
MDSETTQSSSSPPEEELRLSEFLLLSALWMVFGFMLWYYLAVFHTWPVREVSEAILGQLLGEDFGRIVAEPGQRFLFQVETSIPFTFPDGSTHALGFIVNPLIFGYGLPLLFGLVMGSNASLLRKLMIMFLGYVVIALVQVWGVVLQSLKTLAFNFGAEAHAVTQAHGLSDTAIALGYQLGALILPALAPVIVWVLSNRALVEQFVGWKAGGGPSGRNR